MKIQIDSFMGFGCFCTNMSYNCPALGLFGFSTEKSLHSAIKRKIKKKELAK